ncbi:MAG: DNA methyltransferase [Chloroflexi bacterium]|nr:DNA methyltransferase [Chloroflexota bacterium]
MTSPEWKNALYFGDNLDILREYIPDETVDLIYLDPPFNSNATYNVLFREKTGEESAAQITAFDDTWHWDMSSEAAYRDVVTNGPSKLADLLQAMRSFLGQNDMMAYLTMMAQRMVELHRVLKPTGSLYLHCDPTASHYLKLLLDAVFGSRNFRNEIVWRRTNAHNNSRIYGRIHDTIFFYSKGSSYFFSPQVRPYLRGYVESMFVHEDANGRYRHADPTAEGVRTGDSGQPWKGYNPTSAGRHWAMPAYLREELEDRGEYTEGLSSQEKLDLALKHNLIYLPSGQGGQPQVKRYLSRRSGTPLQDIWAYQPYTEGVLWETDESIDEDVKWTQRPEKLSYPTQKPEGLLRRIIATSCPPDGVVLDPFCGCGTAVAVAEGLGRKWVGIDVTHIAIALMKSRLHDTFGEDLSEYEVIGDPKDVESARALATESQHDGRFQFEWWALGLVDARPAKKTRGADAGIDGSINFFDDNSGKAKRIIVQVKSGQVERGDVATLKGDMEREKADIGLFVTLVEPTEPMRQEAVSAGFYEPELYPGRLYPRVQILTIEELLSGEARAEYPRVAPQATFRRARRQRRREGSQGELI